MYALQAVFWAVASHGVVFVAGLFSVTSAVAMAGYGARVGALDTLNIVVLRLAEAAGDASQFCRPYFPPIIAWQHTCPPASNTNDTQRH